MKRDSFKCILLNISKGTYGEYSNKLNILNCIIINVFAPMVRKCFHLMILNNIFAADTAERRAVRRYSL